LINQHPEYRMLKGQNKNYDWIVLDQVIHYASWFRETRSALKNIITTAKKNKDTTRTYTTLWWKKMTITDKEYQFFLNQYDDQKKKETW
jgi:Cys-tRNA synthase (O-phospho-L-seryl-tRNA:Cys-tRNA synthase)